MSDNDELIPLSIVEHRTAIAKMKQFELAVEKDIISLEEKKRNICRIDVALSEFDGLLSEFVAMLRNIPDKVQSVVPSMKPKQYKELQSFISSQIDRMSEKRLYLSIESTAEEKQAATAAKNESIKKSSRTRKKD